MPFPSYLGEMDSERAHTGGSHIRCPNPTDGHVRPFLGYLRALETQRSALSFKGNHNHPPKTRASGSGLGPVELGSGQ